MLSVELIWALNWGNVWLIILPWGSGYNRSPCGWVFHSSTPLSWGLECALDSALRAYPPLLLLQAPVHHHVWISLRRTAIPVRIIHLLAVDRWVVLEGATAGEDQLPSSAFFLFYLWHECREMSPSSVCRSLPWQIELDIDRAVFSTDRYITDAIK
jgi:hypothetical protein